jgi:kynurenine formamidase
LRIIDLTMPIGEHFRWRPRIEVDQGELFRVTNLHTTCHGFSHVDAQAHFVRSGPTIEATPLAKVVGPCRVLDLSAAPDNAAIEPDRLEAADPGGPEGEILLLATHWSARRDYREPTFWTESPWLSRASAEWLLARRPSAVAVDFPQDYAIRLLLDGVMAPEAEHVTHDVLLRAGVTLIEYVVNTAALAGPRTFLSAAPLLIPGADGAPARVFAIEGLDA